MQYNQGIEVIQFNYMYYFLEISWQCTNAISKRIIFCVCIGLLKTEGVVVRTFPQPSPLDESLIQDIVSESLNGGSPPRRRVPRRLGQSAATQRGQRRKWRRRHEATATIAKEREEEPEIR